MDYPTKEEALANVKLFIKQNRRWLILTGVMGLIIVKQGRALMRNLDDEEVWKLEYTEGFKKGFDEAIRNYIRKVAVPA